MTIWDIALYTLIAAVIWTGVIFFTKKPKNLFIELIKNWIGTFFIFSGVVKLVDPAGFSIKIAEYFDEFSLSFLKPFALQFSIVTLVLEAVIGVALLFNAQLKWVLKALLALIIFFTILTGSSHVFKIVQDCGCFGDFLKISPFTSFIKDIILTAAIALVYFYRKDLQPFFDKKGSRWIVILSTVAGLAFTLHNLFHLPVWQFRPYKKGANITELRKTIKEPQYQNISVWKNKASGEEKTFVDTTPSDYENWDFISNESKEVDPGIEAPIHDFFLEDEEGNDITDAVLAFEKPIVLITYADLDKAKKKGLKKIKALVEASNNGGGYNYAYVTASSKEAMSTFAQENGIEGSVLGLDGTQIKTMIRANPGIVVLKEGIILGKYNFRDIPKPEKLPLD